MEPSDNERPLPEDEMEILVRFRAGEIEAFKYFFDRFSKALLCFAEFVTHNKEGAEGIVANAFLKLFNCKDGMKSSDHILRWLFVIARNSCIDFLRSPAVDKIQAAKFREMTENQFQETLNLEVLRWNVLQAFVEKNQGLTQTEKKIFKVVYVEEKPFEEAAKELNLKEDEVEKHSNRILNQLLVSWQ